MKELGTANMKPVNKFSDVLIVVNSVETLTAFENKVIELVRNEGYYYTVIDNNTMIHTARRAYAVVCCDQCNSILTVASIKFGDSVIEIEDGVNLEAATRAIVDTQGGVIINNNSQLKSALRDRLRLLCETRVSGKLLQDLTKDYTYVEDKEKVNALKAFDGQDEHEALKFLLKELNYTVEDIPRGMMFSAIQMLKS